MRSMEMEIQSRVFFRLVCKETVRAWVQCGLCAGSSIKLKQFVQGSVGARITSRDTQNAR
jgi:hypothetical protein